VTVTVSAGANAAPVAQAGNDVTITLPVASVVLNGSATDSDGTIASYQWTKVSGGAATLTGASTASLTAAALVQGSYTFRLTVTDNQGATHADDVVVTVNPVASGTAPVANAGTDKIVQLPKDYVNLVGSGTDADGTVASYQWTKVSGPACTLADATTVTLRTSALVSGTYVFRFTVTDNSGLTHSDDATVEVTTPPTVNAGADRNVTLPTSSVVLTGTASDADGTVDVYSWTKESGPAATLTNKNTAVLTASGLTAGTYVFKLSVKDNVGVLSSDVVTVVVQVAAQATARIASEESTEETVEDVAAAPAEDLDLFMTDKSQLENTWVVVYAENMAKKYDGVWYPELEQDIFSQAGLYFYTIMKGDQKISKKVFITDKF
jgi:hypothetical protein